MKKTVRNAGHLCMLLSFGAQVRKNLSFGDGEGEEGDKSPELQAIEKVSQNLETYKTQLGEKADKDQLEALNTTLTELKDGLETLTAKQISEKMETVNVGMEKAFKQILELQEELNDQKDKNGAGGKPKATALVSREEVKGFIEAIFNKESGKKTSNQHTLEIKAAETFGTPTSFVDGAQQDAYTGRVIDPEFYQRRRKGNLILDTFAIPSIDAPKLIYLVKVEGEDETPVADRGGADWILPGAAKPKRSFKIDTEEVEAKKVAIFATVEDKLLRDVVSFETWIREDLMDEMREKINDGLLNNDPAVNANAPLGLKTNATQYTATPAYDQQIADPNYIDNIIAVLALMRFNKEVPMVVRISSDVWYRIHHLKATDGKWLNNNLVYVNNLGELYIAGVKIVESDEEDVPSTHILAIADNCFKIRAYGNMTLERGLNGEDFREDKTSFRGYQEFLSYIPEHRQKGIVYDTFANVTAAIGTV